MGFGIGIGISPVLQLSKVNQPEIPEGALQFDDSENYLQFEDSEEYLVFEETI